MKYLAILGAVYGEVEGKDWWQARGEGVKLLRGLLKERLDVDLPSREIKAYMKIVPLDIKLSSKEIKKVLKDAGELDEEG